MGSLLLAVIYLIFISLGLPDSLLGSGWPTMQIDFGVPSSYAGYVSMTISCMTVISALFSPRLIRRFHTEWIVIFSIGLTVLGLLGFSISGTYWLLFLFAVPYGLGAGSIDAAVNHYVANHYPSSVMNFLHCFYGVGAMISPYIMSLALKAARWNEGYQWTAFIQMGILLVCIDKCIATEDNIYINDLVCVGGEQQCQQKIVSILAANSWLLLISSRILTIITSSLVEQELENL